MIFHVFNRGNRRARIFAKDGDCQRFRGPCETLTKKPMRIPG